MDCPPEENFIRMKLEGVEGIKKLVFDLEKRNLTVFHLGEILEIESKLSELKPGK